MNELEKNKIKYQEARVKLNMLMEKRKHYKKNKELDDEITNMYKILEDLKNMID